MPVEETTETEKLHNFLSIEELDLIADASAKVVVKIFDHVAKSGQQIPIEEALAVAIRTAAVTTAAHILKKSENEAKIEVVQSMDAKPKAS